MTDEYYMNIALKLAQNGDGYTSPNPIVGAVIVKNGNIVGQGFHKKAGMAHAEVEAINDAKQDINGATMYVTLEPCNHTGKTPPCTELIIKSGIKKVVAAMEDPNPSVKGGGLKYLSEKGIDTIVGVCEKEAKKINEAFIKYITKKIPFVIMKTASTLDGKIASKTGDSKWITNEKSRAFVHQIRHSVDAIMVGVGTVIADNPSLTARIKDKETIDPIRVILDTNLSIPLDSKVLSLKSNSHTIVACGNNSNTLLDKKQKLIDSGVKILNLKSQDNLIDLNDLLIQLGKQQIVSLLIEGGSRVNFSVINQKIADKIYLFFAPKFFGSDDAIPICSGRSGLEKMSDALKLYDLSLYSFDSDFMVEGYFNYEKNDS